MNDVAAVASYPLSYFKITGPETEPKMRRDLDELAHWTIKSDGTREIDTKRYLNLIYWTASNYVLTRIQGISQAFRTSLTEEAHGAATEAYVYALSKYDPSRNIKFSSYITTCMFNALGRWNSKRNALKRKDNSIVISSLSIMKGDTATRYNTHNSFSLIDDILFSKTMMTYNKDLINKQEHKQLVYYMLRLSRVNSLYPRILWLKYKKNKLPSVISRQLHIGLPHYFKLYNEACILLKEYLLEDM